MAREVVVVSGVRTAIGTFGGSLKDVAPCELGALVVREALARAGVKGEEVGHVVFGHVINTEPRDMYLSRVAAVNGGVSAETPAFNVNRLCGSGLQAVVNAAQTVLLGDADIAIAGGAESMSRAPFVMPKAEGAFSRNNAVYDTTIGWRFVNKLMKAQYGVDSMPETAENVATDFQIERKAQDRMALASQMKAVAAIKAGHLAREICAVSIPQKKGDAVLVDTDEHPRETSLEILAKLTIMVTLEG